MKVLLINGSPHENGCTYTALKVISDRLYENGIDSQIFHLGTDAISGCMACGACAKLGKCKIADKVNEFAYFADSACGFVFGSPVYYAGMSGQLASFMDRLFYSASAKLQGKPAFAVVSCRRGGASTAFDSINKYFQMCNMPVVPSQYWNQVHGTCAQEVLKDLEGLQTLKVASDNLSWLIKCIQAGKNAGISIPEREPKIRTNFIR